MATEKPDVIVIGGGLVGTSTAYQLAKEKVKVTLLEQNAIGSGTSFHGTGGIPLPYHYIDPPELGKMVYQGMQLQKRVTPEIAEESGIDVLYRVGERGLTVAVTEEAWKRHQQLRDNMVRFLDEIAPGNWGESKLISPEDAYREEPSLGRELPIYGAEIRTGPIAGARVDSYRLNLAYAALAEKYGVEVLTRTVTGLVKEGSRVMGVETSAGEKILCGSVVLAMGNWTPNAEEWLGVSLPVKAVKGMEVRLKHDNPPIAGLRAAGINDRPITDPLISLRGDGIYTIGHTTQETFQWKPAGQRDKPYFFDNVVEHDVVQRILEYAVKLVPALADGHVMGYVGGPRPIPPDGLPMIGPIPGWQGVYLCVGNPGIGCSQLWGQTMRNLVMGRPPDFDLEPFLPDRFAPGKPLRGRYGIMFFDTR